MSTRAGVFRWLAIPALVAVSACGADESSGPDEQGEQEVSTVGLEDAFAEAKDVRKPELEMAKTLVKNLADTWVPAQYTDEYRENLMKIIKAKLKGKEAHLVEHVEPRNADVVDLMERLRQSLQGAGGRKKAARAPKTTTRARRRSRAA